MLTDFQNSFTDIPYYHITVTTLVALRQTQQTSRRTSVSYNDSSAIDVIRPFVPRQSTSLTDETGHDVTSHCHQLHV